MDPGCFYASLLSFEETDSIPMENGLDDAIERLIDGARQPEALFIRSFNPNRIWHNQVRRADDPKACAKAIRAKISAKFKIARLRYKVKHNFVKSKR